MIETKGIPEVQSLLQRIKAGAGKIIGEALAKGLIGDQSHGLAHYVPYKYVSVAQSGGWKSDKQRRYVMAMIAEGKIDPGVPHRTGNMQRAWTYAEQGGNFVITNGVPYAKYVVGVSAQTRMHQLQGWRNIIEVARNNINGAMIHARARLREWIQSIKK